MFTHLLIPLDGSRLAESALLPSVALAQQLHASVTLFHVIERDPPQAIHGERHLGGTSQASAYLDEIANRVFTEETRVERHVHAEQEPDVARSIVRHGAEFGADLIVLCTHGRGGIRHRLFGTVAQRVVALGTTPVLLIPPVPATRPFVCRRIVVPLDAQPDHEVALPAAAALARACGAALHVLAVVPTLGTLSGEHIATGQLLPGTTSALLELEERQAADYLKRQLGSLRTTGIEMTTEVARGDPAIVIIETAQRLSADLVVLGSHGKIGMEAFWSGSVAPRVSGRVQIPLLLVPVAPQTANARRPP